jgi:nucleosome binding factor SPN SPT16 subunit
VSLGDLRTIATWQNDKPDGELTTMVLQTMQSEGGKLIDLQPFADRYNMTKTLPEQGNMRLSGAFTQWTFAKVVGEVEDIIEEKKMVKHSQIQKRMESLLDKEDLMAKFKQSNPTVDS